MKKPFALLNKWLVLTGAALFIVTAASSAWAAAARTKIIVVVPHRILFTVALPVYIAQEKGFYRDANLDVDAVFTRGGGENVQAVVSGDAQIGLGTGTLAVISAFVKKHRSKSPPPRSPAWTLLVRAGEHANA
jgi:ABC-type nitrate/sulfonate/bicarbonate transport system substrate-binding protein